MKIVYTQEMLMGLAEKLKGMKIRDYTELDDGLLTLNLNGDISITFEDDWSKENAAKFFNWSVGSDITIVNEKGVELIDEHGDACDRGCGELRKIFISVFEKWLEVIGCTGFIHCYVDIRRGLLDDGEVENSCLISSSTNEAVYDFDQCLRTEGAFDGVIGVCNSHGVGVVLTSCGDGAVVFS